MSKLPTPDPAEEWQHDPNTGLLRSKATESLRTSKEPTVIVKYDATEEHPAQTELFTKDVPVGTWTQLLYSGCIPADRKNAILAPGEASSGRHQAGERAGQPARSRATRRRPKPVLSFVFGLTRERR